MNGLLRKDFLLLRDIGKQFAFIFIFFAVCDYLSGGDFGFCRSFAFVAVMITSVNLISYDEYYHWDKYVLTLPVSKQQTVQAKYIMMFFLTIIVFALLLVLELLFLGSGWQETLLLTGLLCSLEMFATAISIPLVYRFTARRALLIVAGALGGIVAAGTGIIISYMRIVGEEVLSQQFAALFENHLLLVIIGVLMFLAAVLYISYRCSVRLVSKKAF